MGKMMDFCSRGARVLREREKAGWMEGTVSPLGPPLEMDGIQAVLGSK